MKKCSSCKKEKEEEQFMKPTHKTCEKCIMRMRKWEKANERFYTKHMSA